MTDSATGLNTLRVRLAVLTYRRPEALERVLPALVEQALTVGESASVGVLVVDNDPAGEAAEYVRQVGSRHPFVDYAHEPTPGIAAGRNRALDESSEYDVLIFIDDDERPAPQWLERLLHTYRSNECVAVAGPVVCEYGAEPDAWIRAGGFFGGQRRPTGTVMPAAATNNLLLDLAAVRRLGVRFDNRFGLTGGSDTLFTRQLIERGGRILWCDEAVVYDVVPPSRLSRGWVLRKAFRMGNSWIRTSLELAGSRGRRLQTRMTSGCRGLARVAGGLVKAGGGVLTGRIRLRASGMRTVARGAGMLAGAFGYVYTEYKRT